MAQGASQNQFGFCQKEATYGTIPHSGGTASLAAGDAFRFERLVLEPNYSLIERPDKSPGFGPTIGQGGRKSGSFDITAALAPSGAAGTKPDQDEFFESAFGAAATVVTSTSATYNLGITLDPSLAIWNFRDPATLTQQCLFGAVVDQMKIDAADGYAKVNFTGPGRWMLDNDNFSATDATGKGGLTAFPARPATPTYNGTGLTVFQGTVTLDGTAYTTLRNVSVTLKQNRTLPANVILNGAYPGVPVKGRRVTTVDFTLSDEDVAALITLKTKAIAKTSVTLSFVIGTTAGNICTVTLSRVVLDAPKYDDSQESWGVSFHGQAFPSVATAADELVIAFT